MPLSDLSTLINTTTQNLSQFKAFSAIYHLLGGGTPNIAGYTFLINTNNNQNFGAGPGPVFNTENIFINIANALFQGGGAAAAQFNTLAPGLTLTDKLISVYNTLVDPSEQTDAGRANFASQTKFYSDRAAELGIPGETGGAVVAFGALLNILVRDNNIGIGNSVNDLLQAVNDGSAALPEIGGVTPIETADGTKFDGDDGGSSTTSNAVIGTPSEASVSKGTGVVSLSGTISITDPDAGEAVFKTLVASASGNIGTLSIAADGKYTYSVDSSNATIQALGTGDSRIEKFTVESADGTKKEISFTINGSALAVFTTGTDDLTGTTGNDNFTATTGTAGTLNSGDKLDAAGGTDKLVVTGGAGANPGPISTHILPIFTGLEEIELRGTTFGYDFGSSSGISSVTDNSSGNSSFLGGATVGKFIIGHEKVGSAVISQASSGVSGSSVTVEFAGTSAGGASLEKLTASSNIVVPSGGPFTVNIISNGSNSNDVIRNTIKEFSSDSGATVNISGNDGMSFTLNSTETHVVDASSLNAGLLFTGNNLSNTVIGGRGANFIDTRKGQDDITITSSSSVTDKISFEGVKTSADFNTVRGFVSGGGGDVISINASDTSAGTSASNPPVVQTVVNVDAPFSFNTAVNDILELAVAIDFSGPGSASSKLIAGVNGQLAGQGSGYIVAYSTAGEALLFYAEDTSGFSVAPVFEESEIQFVGNLVGVSMGSMTTANFDLIP